MLRKNTIAQGLVLGTILAKRGVGLEAHAETPLAQVVEESVMDAPARLAVDAATRQPVVAAEPVEELLTRNSTREEGENTYPHDQALDQVITRAAEAVQYNLTLAKTVVNPMIERVVEQCKQSIATAVEAAVSPYTLVPYYTPSLYTSPEFAEFVSRYSESPVLERFRSVGGAAPADLDSVFAFGTLEFDQHLDQMKQSLGAEGLAEIWKTVMDGSIHTNIHEFLVGKTGDTVGQYVNVHRAPLVLALALRMYDNPIEGANCSIEEWNEYFSQLIAGAGNITASRFRRMRTLETSFELGRREVGRVLEVLVSGPIFDAYLGNGGEIDVVYGALAQGVQLDAQVLLERHEQFRKSWTLKFSILQRTANHQKTGALVRALSTGLAREISGMEDGVLPVAREQLQARVADAIAHVRDGDADQLWYVARKAVCRTIFPHTDAERILRAIDTAVEKNPELDIREASLLATMDYVVEWVADMIVSKNVKVSG